MPAAAAGVFITHHFMEPLPFVLSIIDCSCMSAGYYMYICIANDVVQCNDNNMYLHSWCVHAFHNLNIMRL